MTATRRAPWRRKVGQALWLVAAMVGAGVASANPQAPLAASALPAMPALRERIGALESQGRARPQDTAALVAAEIDRVRPFSAAHRELLTVQGLMLADAADGAAAERSAQALDAWGLHPRAEDRALAAAAALLIRADLAARGGGDLKQADALVRDAMTRLPAEVGLEDRYRFAAVHGYIKDRAALLEDAVRLNHEALAVADRLGTPWRRAEARSALAYSYYGARQLERAWQLSEEAVAIATEAGDWVAMGRAHNTAGIVLDGLGDQEGERRSFELAIAYAGRAGSKRDEARYLANIGFAHISMQHLETGKRFVAEAIAIDEDRGAIAGAASTWQELGSYLEKAGDLRGAVAAYHRHRKLMASVLRADEQKAILAIQEQYDAEQRNRSLDLLQREQQLKAEQLRRRDLEQLLWGLAAGVSLLSFAVIVGLLRRVRQANRLLSASNQVLRQHGERDPL
ncbi:MAG: hypothetical protein IIZ92_07180, partial [Aquincola sp.]|nr:hypothetical protein [Aquincola sp.]